MRLKIGFFALLLGCAAYGSEGVLIIESFERFKVGDVPSKGWRTRDGNAKGIYSVEEEATQKFLRAKYTSKSVQLFKESGWKISSHPWLSWKWRIHEFPKGSDERDRSKNDSAAGVYVVFPGAWFIPRTIKYVWSETVPQGTVIKHDDRFPIIVVRSGNSAQGQWVEEKRNVLEDFKTLFNMDVQNPKAVGFLTDGNSVGKQATADYDEIKVVTDPALLKH